MENTASLDSPGLNYRCLYSEFVSLTVTNTWNQQHKKICLFRLTIFDVLVDGHLVHCLGTGGKMLHYSGNIWERNHLFISWSLGIKRGRKKSTKIWGFISTTKTDKKKRQKAALNQVKSPWRCRALCYSTGHTPRKPILL